jgi:hypothetical protein
MFEDGYLMVVGQRRGPWRSTLPTRRETRGTQRHLASMPTSETSKCCTDRPNDEVRNRRQAVIV